jgi:hypothetical protein
MIRRPGHGLLLNHRAFFFVAAQFMWRERLARARPSSDCMQFIASYAFFYW